MVLDPSCITHTAGRKDHLRAGIFIDRPGIVAGDGCFQSRKANGVDALLQQLHSLVIKIAPHMRPENVGGFICQWAVYPYLKIVMVPNHFVFLDLTDKIQHLLRTPNCKRWDHHISSPVKGPLDHLRERCGIIHRCIMAPIPVSRFHDHVICTLWILRVTDQWLVEVSNIPGKYKFLLDSLFIDPDFNGGRP